MKLSRYTEVDVQYSGPYSEEVLIRLELNEIFETFKVTQNV